MSGAAPSAPGSPTQQTAPSTTFETTANTKSTTALAHAKQNLHYLWNPATNTSPHPARLRTRALLRALHHLTVFIFWRALRYARYAAVGAAVAALGATAFGSVVSGAAVVLAPPTFAASIGIGLLWAVGSWGVRFGARRWGGGKVKENGGTNGVGREGGNAVDVSAGHGSAGARRGIRDPFLEAA